MKKLLLILLCFPLIGFGQNVNIPDANFKAYLVGEPSINTNGDTEIQVGEATNFSGGIYCPSMNITDLTGIEAFTALTELDCIDNQLTNLDLSNNVFLEYLDCAENELKTLDITYNTSLTELYCHDNQLITLDVKNGNNTNVTHFWSFNNSHLYCINVDNTSFSTTNWTTYIDVQHYFSNNCSGTISIQEHSSNKELLKVTDLLGRETKQTNQLLIYLYDDGTVEKRIVIE